MSAYMNKAIKEAKLHTSWINTNHAYERAVDAFVRAVLAPARDNPFLGEVAGLWRSLARAGALTSLSQVLLKITAPGVPDFYQGTELWDLSLVDPDNRRPVDYTERRALLEQVQRLDEGDRRGFIREQLAALDVAAPNAGALKMFVMRAALRFRRARRRLFEQGAYVPLDAEGGRRRNVVAFARRTPDGAAALVVAGRFFAELGASATDGGEVHPPVGPAIWNETSVPLTDPLPRGRYREVLSDRTVETDGQGRLALGDLFADLPLALLEPMR
jgi:(1->4)-alpha-D-glucan 1-alpha-D-glucosylmutase